MGAPRVIDFEKLYHSNNYGDFHILREVADVIGNLQT